MLLRSEGPRADLQVSLSVDGVDVGYRKVLQPSSTTRTFRGFLKAAGADGVVAVAHHIRACGQVVMTMQAPAALAPVVHSAWSQHRMQ